MKLKKLTGDISVVSCKFKDLINSLLPALFLLANLKNKKGP
jgi:hypothetical protein